MPTPMERREAIALSLVAKGEGTHSLKTCEGVQDAVVAFVPGELGAVTVTLRADGKPVGEYRFNIELPAPAAAAAPTPAEPPNPPAKRAEDALPALRQAVAENPADASAWQELGNALRAAGKVEESVGALEKSVELEPASLCAQFDLGVAHGLLGRHRDSEKWFRGIVELDPELGHPHSHLCVVALQNLAVAQSNQHRPAEALATLKASAPLAWKLLVEMGAYAMDAGRHGEALEYFYAAALFGPKSVPLLHGLGRSLLRLGRNKEAEMWLRSAVRAGEHGVDVPYDLGLALARQGKRREARRAFRAALRIAPRHTWSWYDLGCLDALDGKRDEAFRKLRRAARYGLNNVAHANADSDLSALRKDRRWPGLVAAMSRAGAKPPSEAC